ncbi:hypothetical protein [Aureimonas sp. AU20]|uniref:hypothetical protein n=1 Tax=Aureimonas sp. AU20 TaxID=1349819 RepID=UPI0007215B38|nr:hypothetical protein [Aureimonas sp. AU20]ALN74132.1 hypothetical protein M673_15500 [Aureimonas sp. AU20]
MEAVLSQAINRLESVLAGESLALRSGDSTGLGDISNRKNQSLLELTRISRGIEPAALSEEMRAKLGVLRERLGDNSRLLQIHIEATAEVAEVITRAMAAAESDGTYSNSVSGARTAK